MSIIGIRYVRFPYLSSVHHIHGKYCQITQHTFYLYIYININYIANLVTMQTHETLRGILVSNSYRFYSNTIFIIVCPRLDDDRLAIFTLP